MVEGGGDGGGRGQGDDPTQGGALVQVGRGDDGTPAAPDQEGDLRQLRGRLDRLLGQLLGGNGAWK